MHEVLDQLTGDAQTFREKVWASRVLHHRVDPAELAAYLSLADADRLLTASAIRTPSVRLVRDGTVLPEKAYTSTITQAGRALNGLVDGRRVLAEFASGATVVLQGLHRSFPPLVGLVAQLELELGHPCQANAYLTPPGSQGFAVHSDVHDVFVLQTAGTKQWELHLDDGVETPLLEPGHVMYLPTGTPHAARAQEDVSLHITIGINQRTWKGLLQRTIGDLLAGGPEEHLPVGYLHDPGSLAAGLAERLDELAARLRDLDITEAAEREVRRFLTSRPSRLEGGLLDGLGVGAVVDDTLLCRRPGHPCVLLDHGDRLEVLLGDRALDVPQWLRPALDVVQERLELRPSDLPLDPQSRLVLARRLVREGLLQLVERPA